MLNMSTRGAIWSTKVRSRLQKNILFAWKKLQRNCDSKSWLASFFHFFHSRNIATNQFFSSKFPYRNINNNKYLIVLLLTFHNSDTIGTSMILLAKTTWGQILVSIQYFPKHSHQVCQWSKSKQIFWLSVSSKFD